MLPQQYCLRWKYHHSNLQTMFSQLLDRGCFCDVTLACEGQLIRAHRVVLCACSTFFDTVLTNYASERDPIIIMKDVTFADVKALIEFMYKGEINVEHANLASLLKTADDLKIKGLAEVSWRDDEDVANGVSGGGPPPTADSEYNTNSPPHRMHDGYSMSAATAADIRGSPINDSTGMERRSAASPIHSHMHKHQIPSRLPMLTPIPSSSSITIASASSADHYLGPKRKRGRPPLDDAYDVFNVRKLTHYANHLDSQPYIDGGRLHATHSQEEQQQQQQQQHRHLTSAYQQHIHQQQRRQRQKQEHKQHAVDSDDADDNQTDPEWITSNLEVNVAECEGSGTIGQAERENNSSPAEQQNDKKSENNDKDSKPETPPINERERTTPEMKINVEKNSPKAELRFKKRSVLEKAREQRMRESKEREKMENKHNEDDKSSEHDDDNTPLLPQTVEDIESAHQHKTPNASGAATTGTNTATTSSSDLPSTSSQTNKIAQSNSSTSLAHAHGHVHAHSHAHSHSGPSISAAHAHFSKYGGHGEGGGASGPGGYVLNEHGMLMTHDFSTHGAVLAAAAASNGDHDFVDIKMEDYDAADLRLTSEEMSQWQDVIKMDDYLAKGRRPQFWEEPFTRRVLDAIKNKRLEMKKAARILGVSYGTLYGRYREVYGCLKHPYSSTMRPSQSSQLSAVQPRFDIVWPSPKRDSGLLPAPLEMGKIRPKDLSELWARPQI